ncbi:alpha/beta hydrolase family protein [Sulfobacillus harzensis]|uniref:S9 family peptidase n=1 Tax=Sulfobacillus harzensis TaxID=2729629 RepID=A0A7Y0Q2X7_9FIRM|nr:S9 family peptidase [Sulfobacillus harzensis]NMP22997.1 S9 family peptidase [Sulfobacillus harzensis]
MARRPLTPQDLLRFELPETITIHPSGREIYYVHQRIDPDTNRYHRHIRAIGYDTRASRDLTAGPSDRDPACSDDGRHLAFVRTRDDVDTVFVLPFSGGEPMALTQWDRDVSHPLWMPGGNCLIVEVALDNGQIPESREHQKRRKEQATPQEKFTEDVRIIDRAFYRLDTVGYLHTERHRQLVALSLNPDDPPRRLTDARYSHDQAAVHPDGRRIAARSNRQADPDRNPYEDIVLLDLTSGQEWVVTDGRGSYGSPVFSPDGEWLYFFGHQYPLGFYSQTKLYRAAITAGAPGKPELVWDPEDGDFGNESVDDLRAHGEFRIPLLFSPGQESLFTIYSTHGTVQIAQWDLVNKSMRLITQGDRVVYGLTQNRTRTRWALLEADQESPGNVYSADFMDHPDHLSLRLATDLNRPLLNEVQLFKPQHFTFQSEPLGDAMDGWFLVPSGVGPWPLVLEVHGGPMAMYTSSLFLEFQMLAGAGIGVVWTNPHGSRGYGEDFSARIKGAWGGQDFRDVMAGLDAALKTKHFDEKRLGIAGGSYGGFMTNWAIGHSDRFQAAVSMRSVVDELSFFGTSDIGYLDDWEWGTTPWQDPHRYWEASPLMSVAKMHTPLLLIHSEEDWRCPIGQAEELFQALKWLNREVRFVRFPRESHELSRSGKPWHRVKRLELIRDWLQNHLA